MTTLNSPSNVCVSTHNCQCNDKNDYSTKFELDKNFVEQYKNIKPPFGFNGLGELVFYRTYSRLKLDGTNEQWFETIQRVVNGCYSIQKRWITEHHLGWDEEKGQKSAREMYNIIFWMKMIPGGRSLWAMGSPIVEERGLYASLFNCSYVDFYNVKDDPANPFCFLMDASMLGCGVGFSTFLNEEISIPGPDMNRTIIYKVPDSREGWVKSVRLLLNSYFSNGPKYKFDYSDIRRRGSKIKGFGGIAPGASPLISLHQSLCDILNSRIASLLENTDIVDIMNLIGKAVVSGNIRRSATLALGDAHSEAYLDLKDYEINPDRESYGWLSNNSVVAKLGTDYTNIASRTIKTGEPGYYFLENVKDYGRLNGVKTSKKDTATGVNPCRNGSSLVLTVGGIIKTFNEIKIGDTIWSETGWTTITNKWSTGIKKVFKYTTTAGSFYGTNNHHIVSDGEKIEVGQAETIDTLVGPDPSESEKIWDSQDIIDGVVLGDGSQAASNLCIGKKDYDYLQSAVASYIDKKITSLSSYAWEIDTTLTHEDIPITYSKKVPSKFKYGTTKRKLGFLRGLFSANGSVCGSRVTLKASSFQVIEDVQIMLSSVGIRSYYTTNKPSTVRSYDLNISIHREKFAKCIGFIQKYKNEKLQAIIDKLYQSPLNHKQEKISFEIKAIDYLGEEEVFDITVDNIPHTYWSGGLNVSNCAEIALNNMEKCNLIEVFPNKHNDIDDFLRTLKFAFLYGKTVSLVKTHWPKTNKIIYKNRRIGVSLSGIQQFITNNNIETLREWCEIGYGTIEKYDRVYSDWFGIARSIRLTTIKPAGTTSLLNSSTPGLHWPESKIYIRRIRIDKDSWLIKSLQDAGYSIEPAFGNEESTVVVSIPVKIDENIRTSQEVSIWEQAAMAAFMQKHWSDNSVSISITFDPETEADQVVHVLNYYQYQLKTVSFLPRPKDSTPYPQMPYESISEETYNTMMSKLKPLDFDHLSGQDSIAEKFCDGDKCVAI